MTHQQFVVERLNAMERAPGMWGSSRESFGMQLLMLVEFYQLTKPEMYKTDLRNLMTKIFGPGPVIPSTPLEDDWARAGVETIRMVLAL